MSRKTQKFIYLLISISFIFLFYILKANANPSNIQLLILEAQDIPAGMVFGKIPARAAKIIKENPWIIPRANIKNMSRAIYANPNPASIKGMAMVIFATKSYPYSDNIVYYAFEFANAHAAQIELAKLSEVQRNNAQRSFLLQGKTSAVFIFSDNELFYSSMQEIVAKLQAKLY